MAKLEKQKYKSRKNRGITLIALVITIVVMLILAAISISMLTGDNSILKRAGEAKERTEDATIEEQIKIIVLGCYDDAVKLNIGKLKNDLEGIGATIAGDKFPVTVTLSGKKYIIESNGNVQEVNVNVVTMAELQENASKYFGYDVINYAETLPSNLRDTEWQLFYAGALDGETEERIYLISKGFVKNTVLPAKDGAKPIAIDGSDYIAQFGSSPTDGIMPKYTGSEDVATNMQKYNKDYFKDYTSTKNNMKAVAYMLDTTTWSSFATSSEGYAEWAIGGPTIELLFTAYNKYAGTTYEADAASNSGYNVRKTSSDRWNNAIINAIVADTDIVDNPYSVSNLTIEKRNYWLASPGCRG